jgi:hypothetical protein
VATEAYKTFRFNAETLNLLDTVNAIVEEYIAQGFRLTVRQLYYQLVARDVVVNTLQSYKRVASIINDGRLAGVVDWEAIEDRTREFVRRQRWESGAHILQAASDSFHVDMWSNQSLRCFVIIEKEALVGVLEPICNKLDVPILAARGYPSGTVLREFSQSDILPALDASQDVVVFHLGDHDPSGMDMTRDLQERLEMFSYNPVELVRIALNMPQIEERNPPPNPAKTTDSRFQKYMEEFGTESWELDALPPTFLSELVGDAIGERIDGDAWEERELHASEVRERIRNLAKGFE